MHYLVISDIFGTTDALQRLVGTLSPKATIIDPYCGQSMHFADEHEAYTYFTENVGLDTYQQTIAKHLNSVFESVAVVAFSVGASAVWALSGSTTAKVRCAMCFYGSQIRHYRDTKPNFPIQLWFPQHEPHFDVDSLKDALQLTPNVQAQTLPYLHGFMNRLSANYDEEGYRLGVELIQSFLNENNG